MLYVANAREFLRKAGKEGAYYSDPKHVKIAFSCQRKTAH